MRSLLRLDHFVIHIDYDPRKLQALKEQFDGYGIPFEPEKGKGTKGFKVSNIWIGDQYLELPYLKNADGCGWKSMQPIAAERAPRCPQCGGCISCSTTDSIEYAWFVWTPDRERKAGSIRVLAETPEAERKAA